MLKFRKNAGQANAKIARRSALNYYRSPQPPSRSPFQRAAKAKRRRFFSRFIDWLLILALLAGLLYSLMLRPAASLDLSSTAYRPAETYQQAAAAALSSFKNRNKLTFDEKGLEVALKQQFPEIGRVSGNLPLFGQIPTIQIDINEPSLMLRGAEGTFGAVDRLIVDSKGTVVGPASAFPQLNELPLVSDESGFSTGVSQTILSLSEINFIKTIIAQIKQAKVPIASLTLPRLAQQLDLRTTDRAYYVKFYLSGEALTQSGQFLAARQHFDKTNQQPRDYLDVRVNGKVYYK